MWLVYSDVQLKMTVYKIVKHLIQQSTVLNIDAPADSRQMVKFLASPKIHGFHKLVIWVHIGG